MDLNLSYPAKAVEDSNGTWLVTFRDISEATAVGDTLEAALRSARDALETALEFYTEAGEALPTPSKAARREALVRPSVLASLKLAVYQTLRDRNMRKSDLARALGWHLPQVDRLLDLRHASRMDQVEAALSALDCRVNVEVVKA